MPKVDINMPAPEFSLTDYTGNQIALTQYQGKKNVLLVLNRGFQ